MALIEHEGRTWTFRVADSHHLDAPQKAKSKVYQENDVKYMNLRARVVYDGGWNTNSVVVVTEIR